MSWIKNKRRYNFGDDPPPCPCPSTGNFSPGCVAPNGTRNWCSLMRDKWITTDCNAAFNAACNTNSSTWDCVVATVDYTGCEIVNIAKGLMLTVVQYGALPGIIIGTAVAGGYIKYAES